MAQQTPLNKELLSIRHRASELSKAIQNIFRYPHDHNWASLINQCSVISQQLLLLQTDFERGILTMPSKFMVQPKHEHFDCEILGVKKIPQIESKIWEFTEPVEMPSDYVKYKQMRQEQRRKEMNEDSNQNTIPSEPSEPNEPNEPNMPNIDEWTNLTVGDLISRIQDFNHMVAELYDTNKDRSAQIRAKREALDAREQQSIKSEPGLGIKKEVKHEKKEKKESEKASEVKYNISQQEERLDYAQKVISYTFSGERPRHRIRHRLDR